MTQSMTIRTLYPPTQRRNIMTLPPLDGMLVYYFLGEERWALQLAVTSPFQWRIQGRGPLPFPLIFTPPPPPTSQGLDPVDPAPHSFIQQGEGTKYYPTFMVHGNVNVTMYPIKQLGQLRPRGAVFPVWEMTVKI